MFNNNVMTLKAVIECQHPVWLCHETNSKYSGWVLYVCEQRPFLKFDMVGGARIMLRSDRYGVDWYCLHDKPAEQKG